MMYKIMMLRKLLSHNIMRSTKSQMTFVNFHNNVDVLWQDQTMKL